MKIKQLTAVEWLVSQIAGVSSGHIIDGDFLEISNSNNN